jgi:hypothetical protein
MSLNNGVHSSIYYLSEIDASYEYFNRRWLDIACLYDICCVSDVVCYIVQLLNDTVLKHMSLWHMSVGTSSVYCHK